FFEAVSRGFLSIDAFRFRITNYDQETWWRLSWIERSARGVKIFYAFDEYHPARGWALRPDVRSLVAFDNGATVSSNAQGIRGRREYADQRPPGVTRVLVFGDSLTFGDEVSDDETYAAQLERMLPATEVINLGVHGYGHDQMLLYLEEVGARYRPDLVLLGFVGIDMERNLLGFRDFAKPRFDLEGPPPGPPEHARSPARGSPGGGALPIPLPRSAGPGPRRAARAVRPRPRRDAAAGDRGHPRPVPPQRGAGRRHAGPRLPAR